MVLFNAKVKKINSVPRKKYYLQFEEFVIDTFLGAKCLFGKQHQLTVLINATYYTDGLSIKDIFKVLFTDTCSCVWLAI